MFEVDCRQIYSIHRLLGLRFGAVAHGCFGQSFDDWALPFRETVAMDPAPLLSRA